jgi:hypothetical protein
MADDSGVGREKYPSVKFDSIGDKVVGKVLHVGETFDRPNKFYNSEEPGSKPTILTQKIVIEQSNGEKVALYLSKTKQYAAIGLALEAVEQSDIPLGWTLGFKFTGYEKPKGGGSPATTWEARLIPPTN